MIKRFMLALTLTGSALAFATVATAQTAATPASPQVPGAQPGDAVPDEAPENTVVVTGTRALGRTLAQSPVPIDVISSEALQSSGLGETNKILNSLVPSFNFPQPSITDGTDVIRPASLRGLAPDQTLVLVNGKRRHVTALLNVNGSVGRGSAAVDLNTIPAIAIDRIEVLRDGASSQYGSDAIAGVINVQLRRNRTGGRVQMSYGKYYTTLAGVADVSGLQSQANGQPFLDPNDTRVFAVNSNGQRHVVDGSLFTYAANLGVAIGGEGYLNLSAEYRDRDPTNRSGADIRPNYNRTNTSVTGPFDAREATLGRILFRYGDAATKDYNLFLNAAVPLGTLELYAFGSFSRRNGSSAANWRQSLTANNRDYSVITAGAAPTTANFVPLRPDGFLPFINSKLTDYSAAVGVRGDVGPFKSDLSVVYGDNRFDYRTENSLNTSFGPASPSSFDDGGLEFGQLTANLDLSHEFELGFAKPVTLAFGGEYRHERFRIFPGEVASYAAGPFFVATQSSTAANCGAQGGVFNATTGVCTSPGRAAAVGAQGFPGFPASARTDARRNSQAGYAEIDADPVRGLTLQAAGRFEHFSDFGNTVDGKFAARYEFVPGFAVRGSVSNGFRAPSLHQQYFTTTSTNFINGFPVDISTLPVSSAVAQSLGSKPLKPEKSVNWSAGFTASPFRGFNLTADYYHIKIRDRVVLTENLGAAGSGTAAVNTAVKAILDANGFQSVGAARFFINGLDTTTRGFDIVGTYRFGVERLGNFSLSAAYNNNKNVIDKRLSALGPLATIPNLILFGRVEGIRFTDGQPRDKIVLSGDGTAGPFGLTLRSTRYGRVISPGSTNPISDPNSLTLLGPDDVVLTPKWIADAELRTTPWKGLTFAVGANNLFDTYPDRLPVGARPASVGGQFPISNYYLPYSNFSPFGFNGRFLYARVAATF